jgi:GT2 family glycosyltransferase
MDISVIILTCNSSGFIAACLDSLFRQSDARVEVIVADNGSTDSTIEIIKSKYRHVRVIENKENLGAAYARNQAVDCSRGEWVFALDSDVVLQDNFIHEFRKFQAGLSDITGMVCPNILTYDGKKIYSQGIYLSPLKRFHDYGSNKPGTFLNRLPDRVIGPCSAAAFYRRAMLDAVKERTGYFDERFFFLVEDVDLAWRCRAAGWNSVLCPQAACFHRGNSCRAGKKARQYLSYRNRKLMIKKNVKGANRLKLNILSGCYELIRFVYLYIYNPYFRMKSRPADIISAKS